MSSHIGYCLPGTFEHQDSWSYGNGGVLCVWAGVCEGGGVCECACVGRCGVYVCVRVCVCVCVCGVSACVSGV